MAAAQIVIIDLSLVTETVFLINISASITAQMLGKTNVSHPSKPSITAPTSHFIAVHYAVNTHSQANPISLG